MSNSYNRPRVGILTFHRAINYGALLQAFALQESVKKTGSECYIIDYRSAAIESQHKESSITNYHNLKDIVKFIYYNKYQKQIRKKFRQFSSINLNLSSTYESIEELRKTVTEYDIFISGSDQVLNYKITGFDKAYFLDFINETPKKNLYAASFGITSIPSKYLDEYKILLKSFNHLSTREKQGVQIIKDLISREAQLVLDPTLLVDQQEWEKIAKEYKQKKNYILLYMYGSSPTIRNFAQKVAGQTGCRIVYISYLLTKSITASYEKYVGPAEFLGLFKNARYVITNSFHGTCFSINFNKDFFLEMLPEATGVNSRLENILDLFNLRSRQIINGDNACIHKAIDYDEVNRKLLIERQRSLDFLNKIINI